MPYSYIVTPGASPVPFRREALIITEGIDDAVFLETILESRKEDKGRVEIRFSDGNGGIVDFLRALSQTAAYTQRRIKGICLIIDADDDPLKAEQRAKAALTAVGLPAPNVCEVMRAGDRWTGLYIFPEKGKPGMLEDLILDKIDADHRTAISRDTVQRAKDAGLKLDKLGKRTLQVLLAISEGKLCRGPGQGVRNGTIPFAAERFVELNGFLDDFLRHQ